MIEDRLAEEMLEGKIAAGDKVRISVEEEKITIKKILNLFIIRDNLFIISGSQFKLNLLYILLK